MKVSALAEERGQTVLSVDQKKPLIKFSFDKNSQYTRYDKGHLLKTTAKMIHNDKIFCTLSQGQE